ncbi:hypothetical protein ACM0P6_01715 [Komagataeibacter sucrofermentans]|uniref:DUF5666 domain-containing protein n=1 Tax=Komagataeibacter sucrofermentans TaxID=1053551 RepID=A0A318R036_9PROT|nr:hypothetical protein [Komagataeibacter sucrofermentans]PYD78773.1 hypothetical protein CFR77_09560 [Komagataeibacter sucrofermentans]GBQ49406.1 hypothetical protein AA15973_1758 [Komagataeibacter sucrofermentans DSM 15973]
MRRTVVSWGNISASSLVIALSVLCGFSGPSHASGDNDTSLVIKYSAPNYTTTVDDGSDITLKGTIEFIETRDKESGSYYKYAVLKTDKPYRLTEIENTGEGDFIDDSNVTPTTFLPITEHDPKNTISEFTSYLGQYVTLTGKIKSTSHNGPVLEYQSITLPQKDN